jgi:predicted ester cyclase
MTETERNLGNLWFEDTGDGLDVTPAGKAVHVTGISILRVANGRLVEGWQNWDMLGLMEQIQTLPRSATYIAAS